LKPITGTLLALAIAAAVAGCAKKEEAAMPSAATAPATTTPMMPAGEAHPMPVAPAADVDLSGIAKADGGKTIAEVFAEKDALANQPVTFRGKVVKANPNIMGKNWLHVRDGSGAEGTNDLTVTTAGDLPNVGDTVVVTGPVSLNKDFGMGYSYDVLIEDAQVTVEPSVQ
jgi:type IV pilus biogenesis protein CpaD/CtpE